jgi:hypothetical protein
VQQIKVPQSAFATPSQGEHARAQKNIQVQRDVFPSDIPIAI